MRSAPSEGQRWPRFSLAGCVLLHSVVNALFPKVAVILFTPPRESTSWTGMEGRQFKAFKRGVNYGTCWDAVGAVWYSLCRLPPLQLFNLTRRQSHTPAARLGSSTRSPVQLPRPARPSARRRILSSALRSRLASTFAWNADFFFFFCIVLFFLYQPVSALFLLCSSYLTCLASSSLCTCLLQLLHLLYFLERNPLTCFGVSLFALEICAFGTRMLT